MLNLSIKKREELLNVNVMTEDMLNDFEEIIKETYLYKSLETKYELIDAINNLNEVFETFGTPIKDENGNFRKNTDILYDLIKNTNVKNNKSVESAEREILKLTAECWNKFNKLEQTHPNDIEEFHRGIHQLQHIIAIRMCRRTHPDIFPIKK